MSKSLLLHALQCGFLSGSGNFAAREVVTAANDFLARDFYELHSLGFAGLKTNRRSRRDVEAFAIGRAAIKLQRAVRLDEMVVAADLNRSVAEIRDGNFHRRATDVEFDLAVLDLHRTGNRARVPALSPGLGRGCSFRVVV